MKARIQTFLRVNRRLRQAALFWLSIVVINPAWADTIVGSRHDMTYNIGTYSMMPNYINNYGEVCVYCHTPHGASTTTDAPLWNRPTPAGPFTLYASPTMDTVPGSPSGVSLACLSCHDGTIAVDAVLNAPGGGANTSGPWYGVSAAPRHWRMKGGGVHGGGECGLCHAGGWGHNALMSYLTTDLRDDHPISMSYPTPAQDPAFNVPPDAEKGWGAGSSAEIKLYGGKVECPSCHNVHDPGVVPFLRKPNANSALCLTCHIK